MRSLRSKSMLKRIMVVAFLFVFVFTGAIPVGAVGEDFQIGIFWIPRAGYNNATQYDYMRDANINYVINVDNPDSDGIRSIAQNTTAMNLCAERGMTFVAADSRWNDYGVNVGNATDTQIDTLASTYKNHSALGGFYVRDEPWIELFPQLAREYNRFLYNSPNSIPYVNLNSQPWGKAPAVQSTSHTSTGWGYYVKPSNTLGQTFTTASDCDYIDYIEMNIDATQWSNLEALTLTLWNSPAKTVKVGVAILAGSNNGNYPKFSLTSKVSPNTSYYMELTHGGGVDNSVGWVVSSGTNSYAAGTAYQNGTAQGDDLYFKIYKSRVTNGSNSVNQLVEGDGVYINSSTLLGQTFKTPATLNRRLQFIELHIDKNTWDPSEWLGIYLYDSPSKNQLLGSYSMAASSNGNGFTPRFYIDTDLKPNTTYYFELSYGGSNSVGWVTRSGYDAYGDGSAYINGVAQSNDFYFRANFMCEFEDYLESWVNAVGASNLKYLLIDRYPYYNGDTGICADYFQNLEILRNIGLQKNVKTGWFLQSFSTAQAYRQPNVNEVRYNFYTALAYGNKMLNWFTWWTPTNQGETFGNSIIDPNGNKTAMYDWVQSLNSKAKKWGPTLMGLTSKAVYHSGVQHLGVQSVPNNFWWKPASSSDDVIVSYFQNSSGRKYIMVVNRSLTATATRSFNVNPKPTTVTEVSQTTGAEVSTNYNSSTGVISASFLPGEGKLYALPSGY